MNRLKELREKKNLSQKDFVIDLNHFLDTHLDKYKKQRGVKKITFGTASRWENSLNQPTEAMWQALADYFNVSVPYLRGATTYEVLDSAEKGIYSHVIEAMNRAFNEYALLPETREKILKAIAYSIDNGEFN